MLRALELAGFKSFADKTRLEFPPGVTCVVGPNGSGKSNVVDAVKWVLGSQSPKSMRGAEMTDVIFNGAAGRKPMNSAEVTLEFDNAAGSFELAAPVVRITRRVYRSGEGEYLVNGSACRLRDIRELLAGTGVGNNSYNIIEQGRVDAALRASPRERRALFEEAAGVSRFRLKKQEATRRLARVEQNLLRLSDIVDEVEGRLRRVRLQAGKAKRYREQTNRLKQLRTQLGVADWRVLTQRLETLDAGHAEAAARQQQADEELRRCEEGLTQVERGLESAGAQSADARGRVAAARERLASLHAEHRVQAERRGEIASAMDAARRGVAEARRQAARAAASTRGDLGPQLTAAAAEHADARQQAAAAQQQAAHAGEQHEASLDRRVALVDDLQRHREQLDQRRRECDLLSVRLELLRGQAQERATLAANLAERKAEADTQSAAGASAVALLRRQARAAEQAAVAKSSAVSRLRTQLAEHQQRANELRAQAESNRTQVAILQAADTQVSQLRDELIRLVGACGSAGEGASGGVAIHGLVADLLSVDFDTAPMIEAALGPRTQHLVVERGDDLLAMLAAAGRPLATRACFQCLDSPPPSAAIDQIDLASLPGVLGRADRFVEAEPAFASLVRRLLGRVWIVDRLATAQSLAAGPGRGLDFVSFRGEVLTADGVIAAGSLDPAAGVLTRRKQLDRLAEAAAGIAAELAEKSKAIDTLAIEAAAAERQAKLADGARGRLADQLSEAHRASAALIERAGRLADEVKRAEGERRRSDTEVQETTRRHAEAEQRADSLRRRVEQGARSLRELDERITAIGRTRDAAADAIEQARDRVHLTERRVATLRSECERQQAQADLHAAGLVEASAAAAELADRLEACELRLLRCGQRIAAEHLALERFGRESRRVGAATRGLSARRRKLSAAAEHQRTLAANASREARAAELQIQQTRLERETLRQRMQEDYRIALESAADEAARAGVNEQQEGAHGAEAQPAADRNALEREANRLRSEVMDVGPVNLESLGELDDLEERFGELSSQYHDLSAAKASLERLASRVGAESRQLFLATVEEVRGHFRDLFRRLFGGGEADILLLEADAEDPADAGVEIAASPPGKELRSLSLLSGGEKTLTCVALLLAVFRAKPSPFCVLDEVDAALDESNIGRFTSVLGEFLSATQFLVVSHSKKTMVGADTLYGVTMQESGVSMHVSVRLEEVGEDGQLSPRAALRAAA